MSLHETTWHLTVQFTACLTGVLNRRAVHKLRYSGDRLCLLLRAHISHHPTSEQGLCWSRHACNSSEHDARKSNLWWSGSAAAGDRIYYSRWQVVSDGDQCSTDDDHDHCRFRAVLGCAGTGQLSSNARG